MSLLTDLIYNGANKSESKATTVLGSSGRLTQIQNFYRDDNNKMSLQLIMARGLLDFVQEESYTPGELATFQKGLSVVLEFMVDAEKEFDDKQKEI